MSGGWGTPTWMGGDVALGETFVADKSQAMARDLLAAAEALGLDPVEVRAVNNGFITTNEVVDLAMDSRAEREGRSF